MKEQGPGSPEGAPPSRKNAPLKEQRSLKVASEGGKDYSGMLSSIRADQGVDTFVADLRQNKEQLLSLARKLAAKRVDKLEEDRDNLALGIYLQAALRLDELQFPTDPAVDKKLQEERELTAFVATERVALKWLDSHPDSKAAKEVVHWNIHGFPDQHQRLMQEMWPVILPQLVSTRSSPHHRSPHSTPQTPDTVRAVKPRP